MTTPPPTRTRALFLALITTIYLSAIGFVATNKFTTFMTNSTCDIVAMAIVCVSYWYVAKELVSATRRHFAAIKASSDTARAKVATCVEYSAKPSSGGTLGINEDPMEGSPFRSVVSIGIGDPILLTNTTLPTRMNGVYDVVTIQPDGDKVLITLERPSTTPSSPASP